MNSMLKAALYGSIKPCQTVVTRGVRKLPTHGQNHFYFERSMLAEQSNRELFDKIPVVLILGWTGSQDNHVRKYEQIYSAMGYHTIRFAPSNKLTFFRPQLHRPYTQRLVDMMHDLKLTNNTFITHMFSNAGCFILYQHLLRSPDAEFFRRNHKSAIYDSALGLPHRCVKLISGMNKLLRPQITTQPLRYLAAGGLVAGYRIYHYANFGQHYFNNMFKVVVNDQRSVPTLFMYSRQDTLLCPTSMSRFVSKRAALGHHIEPVLYDDCDHVSIFPKHPEDYVARIRRHLEFSRIDINSIMDQHNHNSTKVCKNAS